MSIVGGLVYSSPAGEGSDVVPYHSEPPAREVDLPVPGKTDADSVGAPISLDDAIDIVKNGGDVIAKDKSTAKEIASKAGANCPPVHDLGHRGGKNHYHPNGRPGGHIFY